MKLVPIAPPLLGLNTVNPGADFNSGFAREFTNCAIVDGQVTTRPTSRIKYSHSSLNAGAAWFDTSSGTPYSIEYTGGIIRNVSTGANTGNVGGNCQCAATSFKHASIDVLVGCREPRATAGPGFTSHAFTLSVITNEATITSGCSHRGRPYFSDSTTIEYGDIGQVTGTFATDGLAGGNFVPTALLGGQSILRLFSVTINPGQETENVLFVFGSGGRVLVYSGDWPDADNWQLIGSYDMPTPASKVSFLEIDNDIYVGTSHYPYRAKDLLFNDSARIYESRISKPIENLWQGLTWTGSVVDQNASHIFYVRNIYNPSTAFPQNFDAIVFQCNAGASIAGSLLVNIADYQNQSVYLAYMRQTGGWALWMMAPFFTPMRETATEGYMGLGASGEIKVLHSGNFEDEYLLGGVGTAIELEATWKTPFVAPYVGKNQKTEGIRAFFANSSTGYIKRIRSIYDFSDYNSKYGFSTQSTSGSPATPGNKGDDSIDIAANSYGVYSGLANPGGIGGGVSFEFSIQRKSGSAAIQRQSITAAAALIEDGGVFL